MPNRYQNNTTVTPAVPIDEEEIKLVVVAVWSESSNGTHSLEAQEMMAWAFLNKKSMIYPGTDMFGIINGISKAWDDLGADPQIISGVGRPMPLIGIEKRAWMIDVYDMYYFRTSTNNGEIFRNKVDPVVRGAVSGWQNSGSNSSADPTHGGTVFSHQSDPLSHPTIEDRFDEIRQNFYSKALADPNFNYAISEPYPVSGRPTITVVGPDEYWQCVAFGSCRP
jgi:hypothetical protein